MLEPPWQNLKEIFHTAVVLSPHEREAYLDEACNGDLSLRRRVEELLRSHEETGNFVDAPAYQAAAEMLMDDLELKPGTTVAHYKIPTFAAQLLEQISKGKMSGECRRQRTRTFNR